jgi:putative ABC transport system permease protein
MRSWFKTLGTAWTGITTHKLRSFLTILGIVIGVAAVISLMSIGKGAQADILSKIETIGANLISVSPGSSFGSGGVKSAGGSALTLTQEDAEAIVEQVPHIEALSPTFTRSLQIVVGGENTNSQVTGTLPAYQQIQNLEMATGNFFTEYDHQRGAKVAVLGAEVSASLFGDANPVGQQIRMGDQIVRVIGVMEEKGAGFSSPDSAILIPLTAMQQMVAQPLTAQGGHIVSSILLIVDDENNADGVVEGVTALLRDRHRLGVNADDDFRVTSMQDISEMMTETTATMTLLLGAIAAISLLVGGIGVMNIMLVSVLERTREIGIRKALGAKERDIWIQFLSEAAILSLIGGLIGVAIGWLAAFLVNQSGVMSTTVTADIVILAVSVSAAIGLFFGFYPAWNASRLDPIVALRSE